MRETWRRVGVDESTQSRKVVGVHRSVRDMGRGQAEGDATSGGQEDKAKAKVEPSNVQPGKGKNAEKNRKRKEKRRKEQEGKEEQEK